MFGRKKKVEAKVRDILGEICVGHPKTPERFRLLEDTFRKRLPHEMKNNPALRAMLRKIAFDYGTSLGAGPTNAETTIDQPRGIL